MQAIGHDTRLWRKVPGRAEDFRGLIDFFLGERVEGVLDDLVQSGSLGMRACRHILLLFFCL